MAQQKGWAAPLPQRIIVIPGNEGFGKAFSLFQGKQAAPSTQCWAGEMGSVPSQTIPEYPGLAHSPCIQGTNAGHQEKNCEKFGWQPEQYGHLWSYKMYPSRNLQPELEIKHLKSKIICGTWMSLSSGLTESKYSIPYFGFKCHCLPWNSCNIKWLHFLLTLMESCHCDKVKILHLLQGTHTPESFWQNTALHCTGIQSQNIWPAVIITNKAGPDI